VAVHTIKWAATLGLRVTFLQYLSHLDSSFMADSGSMSNTGTPSTPSGTPGPSVPKAIGSLAKKPTDVTRQGTQKLKFVPTLPSRRKKE
jgi:hypothetical protein